MRRLLLIGYAVIAYAGFLLAVAWSVAFLATTVDATPRLGRGAAAAVDLLLLGAFAVHHSVMARPAVKRAVVRVVPAEAERSTYVLGADVLLLLVLALWQPVPGTVWDVRPQPARVAIWVAYGLGWIVAVASTFMIDHLDLVGLRQAASPGHRPPPFQARWLYALVRHPLMLGLLVAFWATPAMSVGHLLFAAASSAYIAVGIRLEERDLRRELGPAYAAYADRTPAVLPRLRRPRDRTGSTSGTSGADADDDQQRTHHPGRVGGR